MKESQFTRPRPDCPHPEWWHSADDQGTEYEVTDFIGGLVRALQPEYCIETGSWDGQTSAEIGWALNDNGHGRLVCLELNGEKAKAARKRTEGQPVIVVEGDSLDYRPEAPVDFAFFDSDPAVRGREFLLFHPWMHARTVVAFHDTRMDVVWNQVVELVNMKKLTRPLELPTPRGICIGRVRVGGA